MLSTREDSAGIVRIDDKIPDLLREAATILCVQDIDAAWGTFVGKNNGTPHGSLRGGLSGAWHAWCVREAAMERSRRDERASGVRRTSPAVQPPAARPLWKIGDGQ